MALSLGVLDFGRPHSSLELAPLVDRLGYSRYWLGEHHFQSQSASPLVLAAVIAGITRRIRVGPAGVCLPLHSSYRVAEDLQMLEFLYPGRIDAGVCRGMALQPALERALLDGLQSPRSFADSVVALQQALTGGWPPEHPLAGHRLATSAESRPPLWVLGVSESTARLAGELGVGFVFSEHHNAGRVDGAHCLSTYRQHFRPSAELQEPQAVVVLTGLCADSDAEATTRLTQLRGSMEVPTPHLLGSAQRCTTQLAEAAQKYGTVDFVILDTYSPFGSTYDADRQWMFTLLAQACGLAPAPDASTAVDRPR